MPQTNPQLASGNGSLSERAYHYILLAILRGTLPLGSSISRRKLAAELGVSLVPVAEALQRLEADGLVESRPRSGTTVRMPTSEDIRGHYTVREALESQAARLFAEKASQRERSELQKLAKRLDRMYADPQSDMQEAFDDHERLHHRIAQCTGCPALVAAIEKNHILILNWLYNSAAHFCELPANWHSDLVDALVGGEAETADRAMRDHVRFGMEEVLARLEAKKRHGATLRHTPAAGKRHARARPRQGRRQGQTP